MNADQVLGVLAQYQEALNFLANDGRQHLADARLSVFRSDEHFAVFTDFPHFLYDADQFHNWVGCAGDCLVPNAYDKGYDLADDPIIEEVTDAPLWRTDEYVHWLADRSGFSVRVKGQRFDFRPSAEDYARAGIMFEDERSGPNSITTGQFLRFVSVALDHPFFLSEDQLRTLIEPQLEPQMSLFLQTSWWQHPEPLVSGEDHSFEDDYIENIPCWQILARAVATGDLNEWNRQDTSVSIPIGGV